MPDTGELTTLQEMMGYHFDDSALLMTALTHSSIHQAPGPAHEDYERLEFLGDRVLGLIMADELLIRFPGEAEGAIAKRHTALVQQSTLAKVAGDYDLADYIQMSQAEVKTGGREKPAILADVVEAVIGAIYRDGGIHPVRNFITQAFENYIGADLTPPRDPKSYLQEIMQSQGHSIPEYRVVDQTGPDHAPSFTVEVSVANMEPMRAVAGSKRMAEKKAAKKMLTKMKGEAE